MIFQTTRNERTSLCMVVKVFLTTKKEPWGRWSKEPCHRRKPPMTPTAVPSTTSRERSSCCGAAPWRTPSRRRPTPATGNLFLRADWVIEINHRGFLESAHTLWCTVFLWPLKCIEWQSAAWLEIMCACMHADACNFHALWESGGSWLSLNAFKWSQEFWGPAVSRKPLWGEWGKLSCKQKSQSHHCLAPSRKPFYERHVFLGN